MQHTPNYLYTRKIINYFSNQTTAIITTHSSSLTTSPVLFNFNLWKIKCRFKSNSAFSMGRRKCTKVQVLPVWTDVLQMCSSCAAAQRLFPFQFLCLMHLLSSSITLGIWISMPVGCTSFSSSSQDAWKRQRVASVSVSSFEPVWDRCAGQMCTLHFCACCWTPSGFSAAPVHPSS